jgi:hypothetical protein
MTLDSRQGRDYDGFRSRLGDIRRDPPRLIFAEQLGRRAPPRLILEIGHTRAFVRCDRGRKNRRPIPRQSKAAGSGGPRALATRLLFVIQLETRPIVDNTQHDLQVFGSRCSLAPSHLLEDPRPTQAATHARRSVLHALVGFVVAKLLLISLRDNGAPPRESGSKFRLRAPRHLAGRLQCAHSSHTPRFAACGLRLAIMPQGCGWRSSSGWAKLAPMRRALL